MNNFTKEKKSKWIFIEMGYAKRTVYERKKNEGKKIKPENRRIFKVEQKG